jgi:hypothetical protein
MTKNRRFDAKSGLGGEALPCRWYHADLQQKTDRFWFSQMLMSGSTKRTQRVTAGVGALRKFPK